MNVFEKLGKPIYSDPIAHIHGILDVNADIVQKRCETSSRAWQQIIVQRSQTVMQAHQLISQFQPSHPSQISDIDVQPIAFATVHSSDQFEAIMQELQLKCSQAAEKLAEQLQKAQVLKNEALEQLGLAEDEMKVSVGVRQNAQIQADEIYARMAKQLASVVEAAEQERMAAERAATEAERERRAKLEQERQEQRARETEERRAREDQEKQRQEQAQQKANEERQRAAEERQRKIEAEKAKLEHERQQRERQRQNQEAQRQEKQEQLRQQREKERQQRERERQQREKDLEKKRQAMLAQNSKPQISSILPQEFVSAQFADVKPSVIEPQVQKEAPAGDKQKQDEETPLYQVVTNTSPEIWEQINEPEQENPVVEEDQIESSDKQEAPRSETPLEEQKQPEFSSSPQSACEDDSAPDQKEQLPAENQPAIDADADLEEQKRLEQLRKIEERLVRRARQKEQQ